MKKRNLITEEEVEEQIEELEEYEKGKTESEFAWKLCRQNAFINEESKFDKNKMTSEVKPFFIAFHLSAKHAKLKRSLRTNLRR